MNRARRPAPFGVAVFVALASACGSTAPRVSTPGDQGMGPEASAALVIPPEGETCGAVTSSLEYARRRVQAYVELPPAPPVDVGAIADVAVGEAGACALAKSGSVVCWNGTPRFIGIPSTSNDTVPDPRVRPGVTDAVEIDVADHHACARLRSGEIRCWGDGSSGELGTSAISRNRDPSESERANAFAVASIDDATSLAAAGYHACVARKSGAVWCWGSSYYGEGGTTEESNYLPKAVEGISDAVEVAAGNRFTCARTRAGKVWCWGAHDDVERDPTPRPIDVSGATSIVAAGNIACAVDGGGALRCWGAVGLFDEKAEEVPLYTPKLPKKPARVALDDAGVCAAWEDGTVSCIGSLAEDLAEKRDAGWVTIDGLQGVSRLSVSNRAACAVDAAGVVRCFGDRRGLGRFSPDDVGVVPVEGVKGATDLVFAGGMGCVLDGGHTPTCWGLDAKSHGHAAPFAPISGAVDVLATSGRRTCALDQGKLRCTPDIDYDKPVDTSGVDVPLAGPASTLSMSGAHACVTTTDGAVWCWGANHSGQLGFESKDPERAEPTKAPSRVPDVPKATQVDTGRCSACAVVEGGAVWCWGCNHEGVLGNGSFWKQGDPGPVLGVTNASKVAVGDELACALAKDGTVRCWGNDARASIAWGGIEGALDLDVGDDEACVVLADGAVICGMPGCATRIDGVDHATKIRVDERGACALHDGEGGDGRVSCWGARGGGGIGTEPEVVRTPVQVLPRSSK